MVEFREVVEQFVGYNQSVCGINRFSASANPREYLACKPIKDYCK